MASTLLSDIRFMPWRQSICTASDLYHIASVFSLQFVGRSSKAASVPSVLSGFTPEGILPHTFEIDRTVSRPVKTGGVSGRRIRHPPPVFCLKLHIRRIVPLCATIRYLMSFPTNVSWAYRERCSPRNRSRPFLMKF